MPLLFLSFFFFRIFILLPFQNRFFITTKQSFFETNSPLLSWPLFKIICQSLTSLTVVRDIDFAELSKVKKRVLKKFSKIFICSAIHQILNIFSLFLSLVVKNVNYGTTLI